MSKWLEKFKKKSKMNTKTSPVPSTDSFQGILSDPIYQSMLTDTFVGASTAVSYPYNVTSVAATAMTTANPNFTGTININPSTFSIGNINYQPPYVIQLSNNGKEIVRLNNDGSVEWNKEINIDEAAEAFSRTLSMGAELSAGITKKVKLNMRDSVFNDLIAIAKEKGSLTAEDLTFLLEASKIVEKLKGSNDT